MLTTIVSKLRVCLDGVLNPQQLKKVEQAIILILENYDLNEKNVSLEDSSNTELITRFISAKKVEGCSARTLQYYETTIIHAVSDIGKNILLIDTDDLRNYLSNYQEQRSSSKSTIDNIRRILSSFYAWLEDEDIVVKSPVRRIVSALQLLSTG